MQLAKIEEAGSDAQLKLLIDLKSKNPDASPTELLRLFQAEMAALIEAARRGNEPRVEVAPHIASCGIQGPKQTSMLLPLRRVNARIPVS